VDPVDPKAKIPTNDSEEQNPRGFGEVQIPPGHVAHVNMETKMHGNVSNTKKPYRPTSTPIQKESGYQPFLPNHPW
jgi:hypothetical protein